MANSIRSIAVVRYIVGAWSLLGGSVMRSSTVLVHTQTYMYMYMHVYTVYFTRDNVDTTVGHSQTGRTPLHC